MPADRSGCGASTSCCSHGLQRIANGRAIDGLRNAALPTDRHRGRADPSSRRPSTNCSAASIAGPMVPASNLLLSTARMKRTARRVCGRFEIDLMICGPSLDSRPIRLRRRLSDELCPAHGARPSVDGKTVKTSGPSCRPGRRLVYRMKSTGNLINRPRERPAPARERRGRSDQGKQTDEKEWDGSIRRVGYESPEHVARG